MKKLIRIILLLVIFCITAIVTIFGVSGYTMYKEALQEISLSENVSQIKSQNHYAKIEELPEMYINAVIATEDHRFKTHKGVDYISIGRAVVTNIKDRNLTEGGSTITQQLAKNIYFSQKKEITRKVAEIFMAFNIEKQYSKDEILELYLNTSYFGDGCYTVKEATDHYFGKIPSEMTDYEATLLAGIPNAPSVYAPTKNLQLAHKRQRQVLNKMLNNGYITKEEENAIIQEADRILKEAEKKESGESGS